MPELNPPAVPAAASCGAFEGQAVSVIIPAYDDSDLLRRAIWSIRTTADLPYELVIAREKQCVAKNRNMGLDRATQDLTFFMDDDVLLPAGWMSRLVSVLAGREDYGAVSAFMSFPNGAPQMTRYDMKPGELWEVSIPGTCFVYSRARVGDQRFDEGYLGSQWEDTDWMWTIQEKGLCTVMTRDVWIIHDHALSENQWLHVNMKRFHDKWGRLPEGKDVVSISPEGYYAWEKPPLP